MKAADRGPTALGRGLRAKSLTHTFPEQMKVCHEFEAAEAAAEGRRPEVDGLLTFKCLFYD